ncbi:MAG: hypothetical protein WCW16_03970 [Candidatus Magasanikbacteria bacterium]
MSSLNRLLKLAQKTGDTLIIHDEKGRDMVVMDVNRYEDLVVHDFDDYGYNSEDDEMDDMFDSHEHRCCHDCGKDIDWGDEDMYDEDAMNEEINRDIAKWKWEQDKINRGEAEELTEEELRHHPLPDPFEEDVTHVDDWHAAGDVLKEHHGELATQESAPAQEEQTYVPVGEEANNKQPIPFAQHDVATNTSDEENLDDEPVFFEEPV